MAISLQIYWVSGLYHQDAKKKIILKQTELVKLMVTRVTDTDLRLDTKASSAQKNAVRLSM